MANNVKRIQFKETGGDDTPLRDFESLAHLTQVEKLSFYGNCVDLKGIEKLVNLEELRIGFKKALVNSTDALSELVHLVKLDLSTAPIVDELLSSAMTTADVVSLDTIGRLEMLEHLTLGGRNFSNMESLRFCSRLLSVSIYGLWSPSHEDDPQHLELLGSIQWLSACTRLEDLEISGWRIQDLQPLKDLKNIRELTIENCAISDYSVLQELKSLERLVLRDTDFNDLSLLTPLRNLRVLNCIDSKISDITPVTNFPPMEKLVLRGFCPSVLLEPIVEYSTKHPQTYTFANPG